MLWVVWTVVLVAALAVYLRHAYSRFRRADVRCCPIVPLLGHLGKVTFRLEHFIDIIQRPYDAFPEEKFFGTYEFLCPVLAISDLELIKKITVKEFDHFLDHRAFSNEDVEPIFGQNLFSLKGQKWKDMRPTLSPAFTSSKIRLMVPFMVQVGEQMIQSIKSDIRSAGEGQVEVDVKDLLTRYTNDVIASCAFGLKVDSHAERDNHFYKMGNTATNFTFIQVLKFFGYAACPNLMKHLKVKIFSEESTNFFKTLVLSTMKDREARGIQRNDMIHLLMEAKKGKLLLDGKGNDETTSIGTELETTLGRELLAPAAKRVWTDEDLIAQAVIFFIAGFDTVSTAMVFLLFELALNPDVQDRLVQEIRSQHQASGGVLDYNAIQHMPYLDMVVSEVLRLWPPVPVSDRVCTSSCNLGRPHPSRPGPDYVVRKGESVSIPVWSIQRDPRHFPNPTKFDPERFSEENKHNIKPFSYFPFGAGPRICIGSRFALVEVKVMVYQLLLHFEVIPSARTCVPLQLATDTFNLRIKGGHWLTLKLRSQ